MQEAMVFWQDRGEHSWSKTVRRVGRGWGEDGSDCKIAPLQTNSGTTLLTGEAGGSKLEVRRRTIADCGKAKQKDDE